MTVKWKPGPGNEAIAEVNSTSGPETVTLPGGYTSGRVVRVKRSDGSGNAVTVAVATGQSIDGVVDATKTVPANSEVRFERVDGGNWESYGSTASGVAAVDVPDATTTTKGVVQLAGDLAGTAAAPTVPGKVDKSRTMVNVRDYGAAGDGTTDDSAAIDAAFAVRGAVYFPAGTYVYNGNGYTGNGPIVKGDGRRVTQINLGADKSLLTRSALYTQLHVEGIRFLGGFGAIRHTFTGVNVQGEHVVRSCDFSNYTGAAISTLAADMPYWKIHNNIFFGANFTSTFGIVVGGNTDLVEISSNEFLKNRCHIKITLGGNNAKITRNDFIRWSGQENGIPRSDIWVVPSTSGNTGTGSEVSSNKFGNENILPGDLLVVYAEEDTSVGTNRANRFPDLVTPSSRAVRGHQIIANAYNGGGAGPRPIVFSTTPAIGDCIINGVVSGSPPTYLVQYLVPPGSGRTADTNIFGPITTNGSGVDVPSIPSTNGGGGTYQIIDPQGMFVGNGVERAAWPGGGDLAGYVPLLTSAMGTYTATNCTPTAAPDALGKSDAIAVTFAQNSSMFKAVTTPTAGVSAWVEVDVKQGASPAANLKINLYSNGGIVHWQRIITPTAQWRRYRFPWTPRDVSAQIYVSLAPRVASDAGDVAIGRIRVYHAPEPVNAEQAAGGGIPSVQTQAYTAGATWTKPAGATMVHVRAWGPTGGGGSGRQGAAGTVRCGGGGGGGGGYAEGWYPASALPATVNVFMGTPGQGGAAVTAASTDGNPGTSATAGAVFTTAPNATSNPTPGGVRLVAFGGSGGAGGSATAGAGGTGGIASFYPTAGGVGASASTSGGVGITPPTGTSYAGVGGASGGGITSADVRNNGGNGTGHTGFSAQASGGGDGGSGGSGATYALGMPGGGPGGGGASLTGPGGNGGNGALAAGGAGGGASVNGNNSGAGGNGGPGLVLVETYL